MIRLRFVEGGGFDSKIIRWDTRCKWSHVECLTTDFLGSNVTLGALLEGGVRCRDLTDHQYRHVIATQIWNIEATATQEKAFHDFVFSQIGKPYDVRAIVSFGLGQRDWRREDSWFCSEFMARGLEIAGLLRLPIDMPVWRLTPRDIWIFVTAMLPGHVGVTALPKVVWKMAA